MADAAPAKKVVKAKKAAKPAAHPPFKAMIAAALKGLKERGGSSRQAILKYILANYKVEAAKAAVPLRMALKRGVAAGSIAKAKESGKGAGKYKLGKVEKPKKAKKAKKPKKPKAKKAKKPAAKKAKKPAAKKAKKPAKKAAKKPAKKAAKKPAKKPAAKPKKAAPEKK
jgi:hypothetical protein